MTAISLHPTPRWRAAVDEQVRAVGLSLRVEAVIFVSVLLIIAALILMQAVRALHLPPVQVTATPGGLRATHVRPEFTFGTSATIPMTLAALLIPYAVWGQGDNSVVSYFRSLTLPRFEHTLVRIMAGWAWLMVGVAVYVLWIVATGATIDVIFGRGIHVDAPAWQWFVPFTSTTIAYMIGSVAVVGSRYPLRWMASVFFAYLLAFMAADAAEAEGWKEMLNLVAVGRYGMQPAVLGMFHHDDPGLWIGATLAWGIPAVLALLWVASRSRED